jgi:hypothetical protein
MARQSSWAKVSSFSTFRDHTQTHHARYDSSGWAIGPSQRPLTDKTQPTLTTERHPCLRRDSNSQYQQASGHRPTLRPPGPWYRLKSSLTPAVQWPMAWLPNPWSKTWQVGDHSCRNFRFPVIHELNSIIWWHGKFCLTCYNSKKIAFLPVENSHAYGLDLTF